jgi:hypothetical protein
MGVLGFLHRLVRIGPILVRTSFVFVRTNQGIKFVFFGLKMSQFSQM